MQVNRKMHHRTKACQESEGSPSVYRKLFFCFSHNRACRGSGWALSGPWTRSVTACWLAVASVRCEGAYADTVGRYSGRAFRLIHSSFPRQGAHWNHEADRRYETSGPTHRRTVASLHGLSVPVPQRVKVESVPDRSMSTEPRPTRAKRGVAHTTSIRCRRPIRCSVASAGIGGCWSSISGHSDESCAANWWRTGLVRSPRSLECPASGRRQPASDGLGQGALSRAIDLHGRSRRAVLASRFGP